MAAVAAAGAAAAAAGTAAGAAVVAAIAAGVVRALTNEAGAPKEGDAPAANASPLPVLTNGEVPSANPFPPPYTGCVARL